MSFSHVVNVFSGAVPCTLGGFVGHNEKNKVTALNCRRIQFVSHDINRMMMMMATVLSIVLI